MRIPFRLAVCLCLLAISAAADQYVVTVNFTPDDQGWAGPGGGLSVQSISFNYPYSSLEIAAAGMTIPSANVTTNVTSLAATTPLAPGPLGGPCTDCFVDQAYFSMWYPGPGAAPEASIELIVQEFTTFTDLNVEALMRASETVSSPGELAFTGTDGYTGTITISDTSYTPPPPFADAPEPRSCLLALIGIGLLSIIRKFRHLMNLPTSSSAASGPASC